MTGFIILSVAAGITTLTVIVLAMAAVAIETAGKYMDDYR